jgi:hypothetical protein
MSDPQASVPSPAKRPGGRSGSTSTKRGSPRAKRAQEVKPDPMVALDAKVNVLEENSAKSVQDIGNLHAEVQNQRDEMRSRFAELREVLERDVGEFRNDVEQLLGGIGHQIEGTKETLASIRRNLADIRTSILDPRDDQPPGVLGRFGIDPDNPGTFRSRSRLLDLLLATSIDEAFVAELNQFVTNELPDFSDEFQNRIRKAMSERLGASFTVDDTEQDTQLEET